MTASEPVTPERHWVYDRIWLPWWQSIGSPMGEDGDPVDELGRKLPMTSDWMGPKAMRRDGTPVIDRQWLQEDRLMGGPFDGRRPLLTVGETVAAIGKSRRTIGRLIAAGRFPGAVQVAAPDSPTGLAWRIPIDDLLDAGYRLFGL
jgi:hypothetical protein